MPSPYTVVQAKHATLVTTTADVIHVTGKWEAVEVLNRDASVYLYAVAIPTGTTTQPATPTSAADDTTVVPPASSVMFESPGAPVAWDVQVVGNANAYSVAGFTPNEK